ncbi:MAG: hypothetical protein ACYSW8_21805 [Planctomycetota bacterium]|jgi:hypothetical protein
MKTARERAYDRYLQRFRAQRKDYFYSVQIEAMETVHLMDCGLCGRQGRVRHRSTRGVAQETFHTLKWGVIDGAPACPACMKLDR